MTNLQRGSATSDMRRMRVPRFAAAATSSVALIAGDSHAREVLAAIGAAGYDEPHEHANRSASRLAANFARWLSHGAAKSDTSSLGSAVSNTKNESGRAISGAAALL